MKKFFTLFALALVAMAVNAQKTWNFSTWEDGSYANQTVDGLTLVGEDGKWIVDGNNYSDYTKRLKSGGSYKASFAVDGNSKITLVCTTSSSSAERTVTLAAGEADPFATLKVQAKGSYEAEYTGAAATITIGMDGGVNFYAIIVEPASAPTPTPGGDDEPVGVKEIMEVASETVQAAIAASIENPVSLTSANFFAVSDAKVYPVGTNDNGAVDVVAADGEAVSLKTYIWEYNSGNLAFKAVSTPNADASANEGWQKKGNGSIAEDGSWTGNEAMNVAGCEPQFLYGAAPKNGNPTASYKDFYEYNNDGDAVHRVYDGPYWEPGCGWVPEKGCYYEFTPSASGSLKVALWVNKNLNSNPLYIVNASTMAVIPSTDVKVVGFMQNNTFEKNDKDEACGTNPYMLNAEYKIVPAATPDATPANRAFFGYFTFSVEAGTKYMIFSPKSQPGIFGYEFTVTSGIQDIIAAPASKIMKTIKNGKIVIINGNNTYNVAGQLVK